MVGGSNPLTDTLDIQSALVYAYRMRKTADTRVQCTFCPEIIQEGVEYHTLFDRMDPDGGIIAGDPACGKCADGYFNSFW